MTSDPGFPLFRRLGLNYPATCHSARGWDLAGLYRAIHGNLGGIWAAIAVWAMPVELSQFSVPGLRQRLCDNDGLKFAGLLA
jgi:hypothetical protein